MINDRIYHGTKSVNANELLKWCMENNITIRFCAPYKDKLMSAYINLQTKKEKDKFLPMLKELGWKHYHYPSSDSIHKSVGFTDLKI